jgi:hypothetical protein
MARKLLSGGPQGYVAGASEAFRTASEEEKFSEDEMRRPIPRAVPCAAWVCNIYELQVGSEWKGGSAHEQ